jgi:hypothetical protein
VLLIDKSLIVEGKNITYIHNIYIYYIYNICAHTIYIYMYTHTHTIYIYIPTYIHTYTYLQRVCVLGELEHVARHVPGQGLSWLVFCIQCVGRVRRSAFGRISEGLKGVGITSSNGVGPPIHPSVIPPTKLHTHLAQRPPEGLELRAGQVLREDPLEGEEEDGHAHELLALGHLWVVLSGCGARTLKPRSTDKPRERGSVPTNI